MMPDLGRLIAEGDIATILIGIVLLLISGGVGAAVVNGISASKRGVRGDAIAKETNAIQGLGTLTDGQGAYIKTLEGRIDKMEEDFVEKLEALGARLEDEIDYSNLLIRTLSENTIPIPPRPKRRK